MRDLWNGSSRGAMHAFVAATPAFVFQTVTASPLAGAANAARGGNGALTPPHQIVRNIPVKTKLRAAVLIVVSPLKFSIFTSWELVSRPPSTPKSPASGWGLIINMALLDTFSNANSRSRHN